MSNTFVKLFNSIIHSTIWSEPDHVRIVWITMLAMSNRYGDVDSSIPGLARMAGKSIEETEDAINRFLSPDPYSRTPDNEGRRIKTIVGGWHLLNHSKYRELLSAEERKEYNRNKQAEHRQKKRESVNDMSNDVKESEQCQHIQIQTQIQTHLNKEEELLLVSDALEIVSHRILPKNWQRLNTVERQRVKVLSTNETMTEMGSWFGRKPKTLWSIAEYLALEQLNPPEEEIEEMGQFYSIDIENNGYRKTSLATLLNNWNTELDKGRNYFSQLPK